MGRGDDNIIPKDLIWPAFSFASDALPGHVGPALTEISRANWGQTFFPEPGLCGSGMQRPANPWEKPYQRKTYEKAEKDV